MTIKSLIFLPIFSVFFLATRCQPPGVSELSSPDFFLSGATSTVITVAGIDIPVELAQTAAEKQSGLSGRAKLPAGHGLLFVFDEPDYQSFWMKDMNFALDIIWINQGKIVDIKSDLPPERAWPKNVYTPKCPANYVLEVNAGEAQTYGWKVGDEVKMDL